MPNAINAPEHHDSHVLQAHSMLGAPSVIATTVSIKCKSGTSVSVLPTGFSFMRSLAVNHTAGTETTRLKSTTILPLHKKGNHRSVLLPRSTSANSASTVRRLCGNEYPYATVWTVSVLSCMPAGRVGLYNKLCANTAAGKPVAVFTLLSRVST